MSKLNLVVLGKLKDKSLANLEADFLKRIHKPALNIIELKAKSDDLLFEGRQITQFMDKNPGTYIALTEHGKECRSVEFSKMLQKDLDSPQNIYFFISGAVSFEEAALSKMHKKISLSKLTFPHKFARLIAVEQIYRAQCIRDDHPYHND